MELHVKPQYMVCIMLAEMGGRHTQYVQYVQALLRRTSHVLQLTNQIPYHRKDVTHTKLEMLERIPLMDSS